MTFGLRRQVSDGLVERSFRRGSHGYHTRKVNDDICVVVDTGPTSAKADALTVGVGLHSHRLECLEAELLELPRVREDFFSAGSELGHWYGQSLIGAGWPASSKLGDKDEVAGAIELEVVRLRDFARVDLLLGAFKGQPHHYVRSVAFAILAGDQRGVTEILADAEQTECRDHVQLCDQFRRVAANAARRMHFTIEAGRDGDRVTLRGAE